MSEKEIRLCVLANVDGTSKCFGTNSSLEGAEELVNDLDQQTYLIPEGRPVPKFRIEELKPGERHLCNDGVFRQSTEQGEIIMSPGELRQR